MLPDRTLLVLPPFKFVMSFHHFDLNRLYLPPHSSIKNRDKLPYFASKTFSHNALPPMRILQHHFKRRDLLKTPMFLIPNPPCSIGLQTDFHETQWIFRLKSFSPHRK